MKKDMTVDTSSLLFLLAVAFFAFIYAGVGHGGASGYLALMSLFSFPSTMMKPIALLLNLFVSGFAFYHYYREQGLNKKLFFSFTIASAPAALLGGFIDLESMLYKTLLAIFLLISIVKILNIFGRERYVVRKVKFWWGVVIGSVIGFFSGLIGIGGGIILTPVILMLHWGKMKEAATVSALFILVNSAFGLIGQFGRGATIPPITWLMLFFAVSGGFAGAYLGSKKMSNTSLKYLLAFVLVIAATKLILV